VIVAVAFESRYRIAIAIYKFKTPVLAHKWSGQGEAADAKLAGAALLLGVRMCGVCCKMTQYC